MSISLFLNELLFVKRTNTRLDLLVPLPDLSKHSLLYVINEFCRAAFSAYLTFVFLAALAASRVLSVRRVDEGCAEVAC